MIKSCNLVFINLFILISIFISFHFRRGTVGAIIKSELVKACHCFGNKNRLNNDNNVYGSAMAGLNGNGINGSGYRYGRPSNGSDPKSGSSVKNGHNFYQAQALLRKDAAEDVNSQLWWRHQLWSQIWFVFFSNFYFVFLSGGRLQMKSYCKRVLRLGNKYIRLMDGYS